jgi:uncharacterized protein
MCKGQCPGTSIDGDWRNRTEHCSIWMELFEHVEQRLMAQGIKPLSMAPERLSVEQAVLQAWAEGRNPRIGRVFADTDSAALSV